MRHCTSFASTVPRSAPVSLLNILGMRTPWTRTSDLHWKCILARVAHLAAQLAFDAQQLVVLGDAVRTRHGTRLDLAGRGRDRDVGDGRVLGLARAMRYHR